MNWIGDATMADAMLDRLMQSHHRFTLTGESLRKRGQWQTQKWGVKRKPRSGQLGRQHLMGQDHA